MNRILSIQLMTLGFWLVCFSSALCGCGAEEEMFFSYEEEMQQESTDSAETDLHAFEDELQEYGVSAGKNAVGEIVVYVCGAVRNPGVFVLPEGSRVNDVLQAAGGFAEDASVTDVNLAQRLADEDMIYIPTMEEAKAGELAKESIQAVSENSLININTADIYTLCRLPGIGESKARDIVTYREENGTFQNKEDIMQVSGIKENLYRNICDLISVK